MIYYYFLFKYQIILYFKILYSCVYTVSGPGSQCARFNGSGTRLLCNEWDRSQLVVYNLSPHKQQPINNGTILLKANRGSNLTISWAYGGSGVGAPEMEVRARALCVILIPGPCCVTVPDPGS